MAKATRSGDNSLEKCFPDFDCAECGTHYQIHYPANRNTYHWQYDNKFFCCRKCYLAYFERKQEQKRRNFCKKSTKAACAARTRLSAEQALKRGKEYYEQWEAGATQKEIAEQYSVGKEVVGYWIRKYRQVAGMA